jgi:hypothetical protein
MITIDLSDLRRLEKDLKTMADKAVPFAVRNSLNRSAFEGRRIWQAEIQDEFILRNRFTANSVRVEQARGLNVNRMEAALGSIAPYMDTQEFGGRRTGGGRHGAPIPTAVAAGQAQGTAPRTRLVRGAHKLGAIQLTSRGRGTGSKRQRNAIAIKQAAKAGNKYVFLELENSKGLFKITGGRRKPRIVMVWDISKRSLIIPPSPTLGPTLKRLEPKMLSIHYQALLEQLKRHGVFGY